jgi:hypothetical protein
MESFLQYTRYLHIFAGFMGFFVAPVALAVRKGGEAHRRWGQVFFWAMLVAGGTAIIMASIKGLTFMLLTGIFSLYLAQFGYRSLYHRQLAQGRARPNRYDWLSVLAGLGIFAGTLGYGLWHRPFNLAMLVFGAIGFLTAVRQLRGFRSRGAWPPGQWLRNHISGFMGAYIASVSAFSATSLTFLPFPLNFLWPVLVLVPLLFWMQRRYVPAAGISPRVLAS